MDDELSRAITEITALVDEALDGYLGEDEGVAGRLTEAMRYSVFAGGKRIRPALAIMMSEALGGRRGDVLPAACAIEMVHTYSLIHDDLPAMDDDDMRRGKPSSHKAFGEGTAILAGDALLTLAFEVAAGSPGASDPARICRELAKGAGPTGMVAGQVADLAAEGKPGTLDDLRYIHLRKTAALIRASARIGAVAAGAGEAEVTLAGRFGETLGLLFQITDDILDETAESGALGKTAGKDAAAGKLTYPKVLGLEEARDAARRTASEALSVLEELAGRNTMLWKLVEFVLNRSF
ncbi:MAG: polyprenyl synthetase family protein [Planctomycetota bacterium]|jgi:geranylgeranyl diphosphate synthase type II